MTVTDRDDLERLARVEKELWNFRCRSDLTAFCIEALAPMNQTPARHHRLMIEKLEAVERGEIDRLMIFMPPGHAKSTYASVLFPAWFYAQRPHRDLIGASHASSLAETFSKSIQTQIRHNARVLGYDLSSENVETWRTTNGGVYRAAGVGGGITGRRSDLTLIDDPIKGAEDAESETVREKQWAWYQSEVYTRRKPGSRIVLIQTRWHPADLGGRLLEAQATGGDQWTVLKLPAICDSLDDPLGRKLGEALWPEWQDETELARIRSVVGEYVWGALYQQDPRPRGASFFPIELLLVPAGGGLLGADGQPLMVPVPMPDRCDVVYSIIDTAIKAGQKHNSTAVTHFSYNSLLKEAPVNILDWDIVQIEGAQQADWLPSVFARGEELARTCGARRGYAGAIIEDKATGTVLLQQSANLRREGKHSPAFPIDSKLTAMGKEERAIGAAPYVVAGDVKITQEAFDKTTVLKGRSANHFTVQITGFRLGSKETDGLDLLDTFTYGVLMARGSNAGERKGI
jgi:hypothetical protein